MKPIFINSSPNTQFDDVLIALKSLLWPFGLNNHSLVDKLENKLQKHFGEEIYTCAFDSARASFYQLLEIWDIKKGDEVIVPAFTCTVIVNPIIWVGAKPIYVDIDPLTLNMDLSDLKKKITSKTKVILAQHTFGKPLEMDKILKITEKKKIYIVEDCAHAIGVNYKGKQLGTWGDAAVITFGITKVISGARGGMAIVKDKNLYSTLKVRQKSLPNFPISKLIKFLLNPIIWHFITPIYYLGFGKLTFGKFILFILQKTGVIGIDNIVEKIEEKGGKPKWYPTKMSPLLAGLVDNQLSKLEEYNLHRKKIASIYAKNLDTPSFSDSLNLRYPLYVKDKKLTHESFRREGVILGDWYKSILHIPKKYYPNLMYKEGMCPKAEYAANYLVNLPTNIKVSEDNAADIALKAREFIDTDVYRKLLSN